MRSMGSGDRGAATARAGGLPASARASRRLLVPLALPAAPDRPRQPGYRAYAPPALPLSCGHVYSRQGAAYS